METSVVRIQNQNISAINLSIPGAKHPPSVQNLQKAGKPGARRLKMGEAAVGRCGKGNKVQVEVGGELERELEEEGKEWREMESCKGEAGKGVAEVVECLEREAITAEDYGKDPADYYRRAQIFHKSSKLFQALKEDSSCSLSS